MDATERAALPREEFLARRHDFLASAFAAALLAFVLGALFFVYFHSRYEPPAPTADVQRHPMCTPDKFRERPHPSRSSHPGGQYQYVWTQAPPSVVTDGVYSTMSEAVSACESYYGRY